MFFIVGEPKAKKPCYTTVLFVCNFKSIFNAHKTFFELNELFEIIAVSIANNPCIYYKNVALIRSIIVTEQDKSKYRKVRPIGKKPHVYKKKFVRIVIKRVMTTSVQLIVIAPAQNFTISSGPLYEFIAHDAVQYSNRLDVTKIVSLLRFPCLLHRH